MVVQGHVQQQRLLQVQSTVEAMAFEEIGDAPVETLHHAVDALRPGLGQSVFHAQAGAQQIELVFSCGLARTRQRADP